jgi:hypothetical protein
MGLEFPTKFDYGNGISDKVRKFRDFRLGSEFPELGNTNS